jgi:hypothetical protein
MTATDSAHRLAEGSAAPLCKVVTLSAAHGCDDQPATCLVNGDVPAHPTIGQRRHVGRRLSEEITVPASDQQYLAPVHDDLG